MALSLNPEYWGPHFWEVMYLAAVGFSSEPTVNEKIGFRMFYDSLRYVLPCQKCRKEYDQYVNQFPLTSDDTSSPHKLFDWVYRLHSHVTRRLSKRAVPSLEEAKKNFFPPLSLMPPLQNEVPKFIAHAPAAPLSAPSGAAPAVKASAARPLVPTQVSSVALPLVSRVSTFPVRGNILSRTYPRTSILAAVPSRNAQKIEPIKIKQIAPLALPVPAPLPLPVPAPLPLPVPAPVALPLSAPATPQKTQLWRSTILPETYSTSRQSFPNLNQIRPSSAAAKTILIRPNSSFAKTFPPRPLTAAPLSKYSKTVLPPMYKSGCGCGGRSLYSNR